jgi:SAM-dependent methyltransferase
VQREFAMQAQTFEDPSYLFGDRRIIGWIQEHVPAVSGDAVLDVAGGTGRMARAYAPDASLAVVLDLTPQMLTTGGREARNAGLSNVLFVRGDAAEMPFLDRTFDLVLSRFAVHHFPEPTRQIDEMTRVCRPGGRVAIIDLVAAEESLAAEHDRIERLRDPSHTRGLSVRELSQLLQDAEAPVEHETFREQRLPVERWLSQAQTPPDVASAIRAELAAELDGGPPTGARASMHDGELHLTQRWAILLGRKAASTATS